MYELIAFAVVMALIIPIIAEWSIKCDRDFNRKWPAISDDEFIAKCAPATNRERALKVRRIISEQLGVPYERIHPDQSFVDDLNAD